MGADSICLKDMAGLLKPYDAYDLIKALKETVKVPIQLHTHYTAGVASMTCIKAIEAGVDIVDTALSPMAMGTSHPPPEPRVAGGMLSNLVSQLKQAGKSDKLDEVLAEVPRVRADAGYPPLVTPSSQIVGTQAVFNVIMGERYKNVTKEFKGLVRGEYGKTPMPIKPEFQKQILGDVKPITYRPADDLKPELDELREKVKPWAIQDEDVLSYALFEQVATKFFEWRKNQQYGIDAEHSDAANKIHTV